MCCFKNSWGWMVTFSTFLLILPVTGILSSFGVIFVKLQLEYEISDFALGWIGSVAFGIMFAASPISTGLFKRFSHRKVVVVGVLCCSAGLLLSAAVPHPYYLFATYSLLFGVGSNFIDNTTLNLVGTYFPRKNSARASCFATLGWSIGSLALNPAIEILCEKYGWRKTFIILGACLFVEGLLCASVLSKRVDYVVVELPEEEESEENSKEYYNDEEIKKYDDNNDVFVKKGFYLGGEEEQNERNAAAAKLASTLASQLDPISESVASQENISQNQENVNQNQENVNQNQNCHNSKPLARKESVSFAPTTQVHNGHSAEHEVGALKEVDDSETATETTELKRNGSVNKSTNGSTSTNGSAKQNGNNRPRRSSSMSRKDSFLSRRDSLASFIRRDSAMSRNDRRRSSIKIPVPDNTPKHTTKEYVKAFLKTFKTPGILLWIAANILMNMSLIFPFVNFIKYMETIGIPSAKGVHVLMVFGVCDLVGRGSSALFGDYIPFHTIYVYPISNLIMGSVTMTLLVITTIQGLYGYAIVVGCLTGIVNSMLLKVTMDLFGHVLLAEAWTLTLLAAGIGITFGPSIAGASYDLTQSFDAAFYIGGGIYIMASVVTLLIPLIQRWKKYVPEKKSKPSLANIENVEGFAGLNGFNPHLLRNESTGSEFASKEKSTENTVEERLSVV